VGILDVFLSPQARRRLRQNRWIRRGKRAPIVGLADAKAGEIARIGGRAESTGASLVAPFTQDPALVWLARLEQKTLVSPENAFGLGTGGNEVVVWREEIHEMSATAFLVVDAGARVLVDPRFAVCAVDAPLVNEHPHVNDENPSFSAYLRSRGVLPTAFMGIAGEARFYEARLTPGAAVRIYGRVEEHASVVADGYRDAPLRTLRMAGTAEEPLVVFFG
jgi:hypothetical protein